MTKHEAGLTNQKKEDSSSSQNDQFLVFKQKMIAMKQQYETSLAVLQEQLLSETVQKQNLQSLHQEELNALQQQQIKLKDLLKKTQEENRLLKEVNVANIHSISDSNSNQKKIEQLEKIVLLLEEKNNEAVKENKALHNELEKNKKIIKSFEDQLIEKNKSIEEFNKLKEELKANANSVVDVEKTELQERYSKLKDDYKQLSIQHDETIKAHIQNEKNLEKLTLLSKEQESTLKNQEFHFVELSKERDTLSIKLTELKGFLDESENRLKISQQHLAKKVKEATLLSEQVNDLQSQMIDFQQQFENGKMQIHHLQSAMDLHQKQEKKLQDQLQDTLKSNEMQLSKWEEKYIKMYEKWQECEVKMRELKKIEERYFQIQALISNLNSFVNSPFSQSSFQSIDSFEKGLNKTNYFNKEEARLNPADIHKKEPSGEEKYDLFGMRYHQDKFRSVHFHE